MNKEFLKTKVARVAIVAPGWKAKSTNPSANQEMLFGIRPGNSKQQPYALSLLGGKFEQADFFGTMSLTELEDKDAVPSEVQMLAASRKAAGREIGEEAELFNLPLLYVLCHTNDAQYTTYVYVAQFTEKPKISVPRDSAGAIWVATEQLANYPLPFLADNLIYAQAALHTLAQPENQQVVQGT